MATREEIREWLITCLAIQHGTIHGKSPTDEQVADSILPGLHSQSVMRRVKCPNCEWSQFGEEHVGMTPCYSCNSTGYIFEPLVEKYAER